jgi:hypothetical protein
MKKVQKYTPITQTEEPNPNYSQLIEADFGNIENDQYELIEHIQERFGQGRNEVEALINGYDS